MDTDARQLHSSVFILFIGGHVWFSVSSVSSVAERFFFAFFAARRLLLL
jgi:hypothetical protein